MKTMILDTSSLFLYVCFLEDDQIIYSVFSEGKNNHSENLLKIIEEGLHLNNLNVNDFNKIIVGIGPGSYTGLRVSLTVAKMFSWTLNIPLFTVSSLDLLGSGHFDGDGIYAITMAAKKDYVYGKLIEVNAKMQYVIIDDSFLRSDEFFNSISSYQYQLIDKSKYLVNPINLKVTKVKDLHSLAPNYLRGEL